MTAHRTITALAILFTAAFVASLIFLPGVSIWVGLLGVVPVACAVSNPVKHDKETK